MLLCENPTAASLWTATGHQKTGVCAQYPLSGEQNPRPGVQRGTDANTSKVSNLTPNRGVRCACSYITDLTAIPPNPRKCLLQSYFSHNPLPPLTLTLFCPHQASPRCGLHSCFYLSIFNFFLMSLKSASHPHLPLTAFFRTTSEFWSPDPISPHSLWLCSIWQCAPHPPPNSLTLHSPLRLCTFFLCSIFKILSSHLYNLPLGDCSFLWSWSFHLGHPRFVCPASDIYRTPDTSLIPVWYLHQSVWLALKTQFVKNEAYLPFWGRDCQCALDTFSNRTLVLPKATCIFLSLLCSQRWPMTYKWQWPSEASEESRGLTYLRKASFFYLLLPLLPAFCLECGHFGWCSTGHLEAMRWLRVWKPCEGGSHIQIKQKGKEPGTWVMWRSYTIPTLYCPPPNFCIGDQISVLFEPLLL